MKISLQQKYRDLKGSYRCVSHFNNVRRGTLMDISQMLERQDEVDLLESIKKRIEKCEIEKDQFPWI